MGIQQLPLDHVSPHFLREEKLLSPNINLRPQFVTLNTPHSLLQEPHQLKSQHHTILILFFFIVYDFHLHLRSVFFLFFRIR
jgi:hypothetical protein